LTAVTISITKSTTPNIIAVRLSNAIHPNCPPLYLAPYQPQQHLTLSLPQIYKALLSSTHFYFDRLGNLQYSNQADVFFMNFFGGQ
jgi:hypothetical protein